MAINGHYKIFDKSRCLGKDGATITASSGGSSADFALDQNSETSWRSSGSNDLTTETIEVSFTSQEISRIFLLGHNLKDYDIMYDLSGVWTHFASVVGIGGSLANITETTFAQDTSYYEFTPVTTTKIRIRANKTQVANEEKYIGQIVVTTEIATLAGWPRVKGLDLNRNARSVKTLSGFYSIQKSLEVPSFDFEFKDYPANSTYSVDIDTMMELEDREEPFLIWLCGGKFGSTFFKYTLRGWRLKDLFQMQVSKAIRVAYSDGIYSNQINAKVEFEAVI
jgi:hypothetical protein